MPYRPYVCNFSAHLAIFITGLSGLAFAADPTSPQKLDRITGEYQAFVVAEGLGEPADLAFHPLSGDLYVSEKKAGCITRLRHGLREMAVSSGFRVIEELPPWALMPEKPRAYWFDSQLHNPAGIAFSADGHLFVVEDTMNGRLLEFIPDAVGQYQRARVIPIPWLYKNYSWESVAAARDGRLFVAGAATEAGPGLHFGSVLMRDPKDDWWIVDYGPFAGFSSVYLSANQDVLVVGDEVGGTLTWWDAARHRAIGTVKERLPDLDSAAVLPDGAIAVFQRPPQFTSLATDGGDPSMPDGRLVRVDPQSGEMRTIASGFGYVEGVQVSPANDFVYLVEVNSGLLMELRPTQPPPRSGGYLLKRAVTTYEISQGLPPKEWPPFMRGFFKDMGLSVDSEPSEEAPPGEAPLPGSIDTYTLQEGGKSIPIIAGTLKTTRAMHRVEEDPITRLDFVIIFPNRFVCTPNFCTPSLTLFSALRQSGKTDITQNLSDLTTYRYDEGQSEWRQMDVTASIYFPLSTCSVRARNGGVDITVALVGLEKQEDYFIQLTCGKENSGTLVVDYKQGGRVQYGVDFTEYDQDGIEYNNLVVSGFSSEQEINPGWMNIGKLPLGYAISPEHRLAWTPYSMNPADYPAATLTNFGVPLDSPPPNMK